MIDIYETLHIYKGLHGKKWFSRLVKDKGLDWYFKNKVEIRNYFKSFLGWDSSEISTKIYEVEKRIKK